MKPIVALAAAIAEAAAAVEHYDQGRPGLGEELSEPDPHRVLRAGTAQLPQV